MAPRGPRPRNPWHEDLSLDSSEWGESGEELLTIAQHASGYAKVGA